MLKAEETLGGWLKVIGPALALVKVTIWGELVRP